MSHLELRVDFASDIPFYQQIAHQIRQQIASGALTPGDPLPTVRGLADQLGCNPSTVSRAYTELTRDGVIAGRRGAGTHVAEPSLPTSETLRQARLANLVERPLLEALSAGYTPSEIEVAFSSTLERWRELRQAGSQSAQKTTSPNRLRFVGSHDPAVELLAARLRRQDPTIDLSVTFAGSLGGLMALARGEADIAGTHLRDEQTGEYNVDYVRHILPGRPVSLITLVTRSVGLIVATGNPKEIGSVEDLARADVRIINRQAGSGTRVLLDAQLRELGITSSEVAGYEREVTTHMALAAAVAEGDADVGVGVQTVAQANGLDFIPLLRERYDLVIPEETQQRPPIQSMFDVIRSDDFHSAVEALGGYNVSEMGHEVRLD